MKTSMQLKALVRNLSRETSVEAEVILRNFMLERLLERIAISEYKQNFILKGGMLIASMVGISARTTMDMDATIKGRTLNASEITAAIEEILCTPIDDSVEFSVAGIEEIRGESDYPGYRVSIEAVLDKTRQTLKIDIATGDFVTPREIEYSFKLMFEDRAIRIMAYNVETILAEKLETIITRGVLNTRMRDFYDIHILTTTQAFDRDIFKAALQKTAEQRSTTKQMTGIHDTISMISENPVMADRWTTYCKKYSYASGITWERVIGTLRMIGVTFTYLIL